MSIINDALKKVQTDLERKKPRILIRRRVLPLVSSITASPPEPKEVIAPLPSPPEKMMPAVSKPAAKNSHTSQSKKYWTALFAVLLVSCALFLALNTKSLRPLSQKSGTTRPPVDYRHIQSRKISQIPDAQSQARKNPDPLEKVPTSNIPEASPLSRPTVGTMAEQDSPLSPPDSLGIRTGQGKITIGGIVTMEDKNVALINDKIYEIGNTINGMKIIAISLDSVQMLKGDETKIFTVTSQ